MDITAALSIAGNCLAHSLPVLCEAQALLEAHGRPAEALVVEEYLIDQSDEAWEACGVVPH
jgi:hypothetical protein